MVSLKWDHHLKSHFCSNWMSNYLTLLEVMMKKSVSRKVRIFVFLIMSPLLLSCAGPTVPSIVQDGAQPYLPGKFVWYDLFTTDLIAVEGFYQELFGWKFATSGFMGGSVKTIRLNGEAIANAVEIEVTSDDPKESRWLGYISVEDVDNLAVTVNRIKKKKS